MCKRTAFSWLAAPLTLMAMWIFGSAAQAQTIPGTTIPDTVTQLVISNQSPQTITGAITIPGGGTLPGCTSTIANLQTIALSPVLGPPTALTNYDSSAASTTRGIFTVNPGQSVELVNILPNGAAGEQNCLQGFIITFNQINTVCPGVAAPFPTSTSPSSAPANGVNALEGSLNLPNSGNETLDNTCINGDNAIIQTTLAPSAALPGATPWVYAVSPTPQNVPPGSTFSSQNSWLNIAAGCDNNCNPPRAGVFPFGCTQCNRLPDPQPPCGQFCAAANGLPPNKGCTFDRSPDASQPVTKQFGGFVTLTYVGPAIPLAVCSNGNSRSGRSTTIWPIKHQIYQTKHDVVKFRDLIKYKPAPSPHHQVREIHHAVTVDDQTRVFSDNNP